MKKAFNHISSEFFKRKFNYFKMNTGIHQESKSNDGSSEFSPDKVNQSINKVFELIKKIF